MTSSGEVALYKIAVAILLHLPVQEAPHESHHLYRRINTLIQEIKRNPFEGIGKPEPLKHALSGYWSRRINDEHRIVYKVTSDAVHIAQLRYHY